MTLVTTILAVLQKKGQPKPVAHKATHEAVEEDRGVLAGQQARETGLDLNLHEAIFNPNRIHFQRVFWFF